MSHTPGEWAFQHQPRPEIEIAKERSARAFHIYAIDAAGTTTAIADTANYEWTVKGSQHGANAMLIAAAPDLLAVCKAVAEEDGFRGSALMRKRIDAMKAAIAKAEGKVESNG